MNIHPVDSLVLPYSILVIGAFDGVHKGHQTLIQQAAKRAEALQMPLVVYTFDPSPRIYFQKAIPLTSLQEKIHRLDQMAVDHTIVATFNAEYAMRTAEQFYEEIKQMNPIEIWVGTDFKFGADRKGDVHSLRKRFQVQTVEPVCCSNGEVISSTRIRNLLIQNRQTRAEQLLGW